MNFCGNSKFPLGIEIYSNELTGIYNKFNGLKGISIHPLNNKLENWIGILFKDLNETIDIRIEDISIWDENNYLYKIIESLFFEKFKKDDIILEELEEQLSLPIEILEKELYMFKKRYLKNNFNLTFKGSSEHFFVEKMFEDKIELLKENS